MLGCLPHGVANLQICANDANDVAKCLNEAQNLLKLSQQFACLSLGWESSQSLKQIEAEVSYNFLANKDNNY